MGEGGGKLMGYTFSQLRELPTPNLRVLQFAYFCLNKAARDGDPGTLELARIQRDIVHVLTIRNERIFGPDCLLNVNSDPRWKLADNRKGVEANEN
jgi:hypothetical protein